MATVTTRTPSNEQLIQQRRQSIAFSKLELATKPHFMEPKRSSKVNNAAKRNSISGKFTFESKKEFFDKFRSDNDITEDDAAIVTSDSPQCDDVIPKSNSQVSLHLQRNSTKRNSLAMSLHSRTKSITDGRLVTQLHARDTYAERSDSEGQTPTYNKRAKNGKLQKAVDKRVSALLVTNVGDL